MTPIYQTSTYVQEGIGVHKGYDYARVSNPTRTALEANVAALEGAEHGAAFASGLAAIEALVKLLSAGDHAICGSNVYGGTDRLFRQILSRLGLEFSFVDTREPERIEEAMRERTRLVLIETPTNPLMHITDIAAVARLASARGAWLVVDNTFATPYLQRPLELGADATVHSTTKYLGGHSDVIGGFVATNDAALAERLLFLQKSLGAVPGPFDCWLVLRGVKTLAVRMEKHCANARRVAAFLVEHPAVERVLYPGLESHPHHDIACRQMSDFGGMVSFLAGSEEEALAICGRTSLFALAESLGGVESLIEHPARMTHASTADAPFAAPRNLIRLSVGIESADDLVADLEAALAAVPAGGTSAAG
jgi:cystathionine beta-lyase/cystathionine gamma-synthase